ncbi:MAG TPA: hypothetical protein VJG67_02410 [Candidatus Paceibacterota bacterium]
MHLRDRKEEAVVILTDESRHLLEVCQAGGFEAKFEAVVRGMFPETTPKDFAAYFRLFVSKLVNIGVAKPVLGEWRQRLGYNVKFFRAYGVVLITHDGKPKCIMAYRHLHMKYEATRRLMASLPAPATSNEQRVFQQATAGQRNSRLTM